MEWDKVLSDFVSKPDVVTFEKLWHELVESVTEKEQFFEIEKGFEKVLNNLSYSKKVEAYKKIIELLAFFYAGEDRGKYHFLLLITSFFAKKLTSRFESYDDVLQEVKNWLKLVLHIKGLEISDVSDEHRNAYLLPIKKDLKEFENKLFSEIESSFLKSDGVDNRIYRLKELFELDFFELKLVLLAASRFIFPELRGLWKPFLLSDNTINTYLLLKVAADEEKDINKKISYFYNYSKLIKNRLLFFPNETINSNIFDKVVNIPDSVVEFIRGNAIVSDYLLTSVKKFDVSHFERGNYLNVMDLDKKLDELFRVYSKGEGLIVVLNGPEYVGKKTFAKIFSYGAGYPLVVFQVHKVIHLDILTINEIFEAVVRDCKLNDGFLFLEFKDTLLSHSLEDKLNFIFEKIREIDLKELFFVSISGGLQTVREKLPKITSFDFQTLDYENQIKAWKFIAKREGLMLPADEVLKEGATRLGLTFYDILSSALQIKYENYKSENPDKPIPVEKIRHHISSRKISGLTSIATPVKVSGYWDELILENDVILELMDIITYIKYQEKVFKKWGFEKKYSYGRGLTVLFSGPPGTGKTMAAGLVAKELSIDLYQIELPMLVSKYIGETEKNLSLLFDEAERTGVGLLFDEGDAIFGKRTEQKSSTDRYANLEVNYLLQRIERMEGLVIVTSNFPENIDPAFMRRFKFHVKFPFPDENMRLLLWKSMIPKEVKVSPDVDFEYLASEFELSGGKIKDAVLRAAFRAAEREDEITMEDFINAAQAEYRAIGKLYRV